MESLLPPMVMPWVRPDARMIQHNQGRAAYKSTLMEHNEALTLDSKRTPALLTTIIATIGTETTIESIEEMIEAGARVLRFDMSNLIRRTAVELLNRAREAVEKVSETKGRVVPVAILISIKGPFILTGKIKERKSSSRSSVILKSGDMVRLTTHPAYDECVTEDKIFVDHKTLHKLVEPSTKIVLDNGRIELVVRGVVDSDIVCDIVSGGELGSYRRVQLPGLTLDVPDLTEKDWEDIRMAMSQDVDALCLPYSVDEICIKKIKELMGERSRNILLLTKVETRCCYNRLDKVIAMSDGIIINRGSLSVEMSTEKVIQAQKTICAKCNKAFKLVFTMTDILGSMRYLDCPTIAEVSDVTSSILDGVDGLIVEDETSMGINPALLIRTLSVLCREAEAEIWSQEVIRTFNKEAFPPIDPVKAISMSAVDISMKSDAAAIIVCTTSGFSAKSLAQYRPRCPVIAVTRYGCVARSLCLFRSLWPVHYLDSPHSCWPKEVDRRLQRGTQHAKGAGLVRPGDLLILISSWRQGSGYTNQMRVVYASPTTDQWVMPKSENAHGETECRPVVPPLGQADYLRENEGGKHCLAKQAYRYKSTT